MKPLAKVFAMAALLVSAAIAQAADQFAVPQQKIVGAEEPVPAGEIIVLQPSTIDSPPDNLLSVSYGWTVVEDGKVKKRVHPESDGSIIFGAGLTAKKFLVVLAVDYVFMKAPAAKAGDRPQIAQIQRILTTEVTVTSGQPSPPSPTPPTPPQPTPLADGKYKLAQTAYALAMAKVNLPAAQRSQACQVLAKSMNDVAVLITSGRLTNAPDILKQTKANNNAALKQAGVDPSTFDAFSLELKRTLTSFNSQKFLVNPADFAQAWTEIAQGLTAVK